MHQNGSGIAAAAVTISLLFLPVNCITVEDMLNKKRVKLPAKCKTPLRSGYQPEMDTSPELKADGVQRYQEMIGQCR